MMHRSLRQLALSSHPEIEARAQEIAEFEAHFGYDRSPTPEDFEMMWEAHQAEQAKRQLSAGADCAQEEA